MFVTEKKQLHAAELKKIGKYCIDIKEKRKMEGKKEINENTLFCIYTK